MSKIIGIIITGFVWASCSFAMTESDLDAHKKHHRVPSKKMDDGEEKRSPRKDVLQKSGQNVLERYLKDKQYSKAMDYCARSCLYFSERNQARTPICKLFWKMGRFLGRLSSEDLDLESSQHTEYKRTWDSLQRHLEQHTILFESSQIFRSRGVEDPCCFLGQVDEFDEQIRALRVFSEEAFGLGLESEKKRFKTLAARSYICDVFDRVKDITKKNADVLDLHAEVLRSLPNIVGYGEILHMEDGEIMDFQKIRKDIIEVFATNIPERGMKIWNLGLVYSKKNFLKDLNLLFEEADRGDATFQKLVFHACSFALKSLKTKNVYGEFSDMPLRGIIQAMMRSYAVEAQVEAIDWLYVAYVHMLQGVFNAKSWLQQ